MSEPLASKRWRPAPTHLVAGGLVIAGLVLTGVSWWFLLLAALGAFGPGVLRELGWLHDKDELQRRADHRAAYHAFLVTGIAAFVLVAYFRSGERGIQSPGELVTLLLVLLWFSYFLSSLLGYWGPQKTARRVLVAFGAVWLAFTIESNLGPEWSGWRSLLMHTLLSLPFFALAWSSRRWPRVTGLLLLAASVFFTQLFGLLRQGNEGWVSQGVTLVLFVGPLLASGIALLVAGPADSDAGEE